MEKTHLTPQALRKKKLGYPRVAESQKMEMLLR